jgi:hypothetical protein
MKKKVLLVAAIVCAAISSNAQEVIFKPAAGEKTLEVNFTPLGGSPISINELKFRKFLSETTAFRLGISVAYSSNTADPTYAGPDVDGNGIADFEEVDKNSSLGVSLSPGIEKHWSGTNRLSPYMGGYATIGYYSNTIKDEVYVPAPEGVYEFKTTSGRLEFGLNAVLGADWYFSPKIYLGTEVGFGVMYSNLSKVKNSSDLPGSNDVETDRGSNIQIGPNFNSAIRLGFAF